MPRATMSVATSTAVLARLEPGERLGPLALAAVAVDPRGRDAVPLEELGQAVGAVLGAREDDRVGDDVALQQLDQERATSARAGPGRPPA